ncbi:MAG: phosphatidate cytidylyltransferase [Ginsengibacter sp.]
MALNIAVFKTRALTAVIFVIVMLGGLLVSGYSFVLLLVIIHFGCWFEFIKLLKKISPAKWFLYAFVGIVYVTLPIVLLLLMGLVFTFDDGQVIDQIQLYNFILPCGIIFCIWINDTMAYLVGSFIGKTPFSKLSPKKNLGRYSRRCLALYDGDYAYWLVVKLF